jgi:hypothetical protein
MGGGQNHPDPGQLYSSVTDTRTSQVRVRYVRVRTDVRQANLFGRTVLTGHQPISMILRNIINCPMRISSS